MFASDKIKDFIKSQEGCKLVAYKPLATDRWTIGYGSTYINNQPVHEGDEVTQELADKLLCKSVDNIASQITNNTRIPANVTGNQFDAVVSLVYNIGFTAFKNSATGKLFYAGLSISDKFLMWNRSGGSVVQGLTNRRAKEKEIYDNNVYPS